MVAGPYYLNPPSAKDVDKFQAEVQNWLLVFL